MSQNKKIEKKQDKATPSLFNMVLFAAQPIRKQITSPKDETEDEAITSAKDHVLALIPILLEKYPHLIREADSDRGNFEYCEDAHIAQVAAYYGNRFLLSTFQEYPELVEDIGKIRAAARANNNVHILESLNFPNERCPSTPLPPTPIAQTVTSPITSPGRLVSDSMSRLLSNPSAAAPATTEASFNPSSSYS